MKIAEEFLDVDFMFSIELPKDTQDHEALISILSIEAIFKYINHEDLLNNCYIDKKYLGAYGEFRKNKGIRLSSARYDNYYQLTAEQLQKYIVLYRHFDLQLSHYINDLFLKGELK